MHQDGSSDFEYMNLKAKPLGTLFMITLCWFGYYAGVLKGGAWMKSNALYPGELASIFQANDIFQGTSTLVWGNFLHPYLWQCVASIYFIWAFGSTVEHRIGTSRFVTLALLPTLAANIVLTAVLPSYSGALYAGPFLLLSTLMGLYVILGRTDLPKPPIWTRRFGVKYFHDTQDDDPTRRYQISPWFCIYAFVIFYLLSFWYLSTQETMSFYIIEPISAICAYVFGLVAGSVQKELVMVEVRTHDAIMERRAMKTYKLLRRLDFAEDEAIFAAAKLMTVPETKVEEWIRRAKKRLSVA